MGRGAKSKIKEHEVRILQISSYSNANAPCDSPHATTANKIKEKPTTNRPAFDIFGLIRFSIE